MTLRLRLIDKATGQPVTVERLDIHLGRVRVVMVDGKQWDATKYEFQMEQPACTVEPGYVWEPIDLNFEQ